MVSAHRGRLASALSDWWSPQAGVTWPSGKHTGIDYLPVAFDRDLSDGVRHELLNVVAGREVVIWKHFAQPAGGPVPLPASRRVGALFGPGPHQQATPLSPARPQKNIGDRSNFPGLTASCGYEHKEPLS